MHNLVFLNVSVIARKGFSNVRNEADKILQSYRNMSAKSESLIKLKAAEKPGKIMDLVSQRFSGGKKVLTRKMLKKLKSPRGYIVI